MIRFLFVILLLNLDLSTVVGQNRKIDSLKMMVKGTRSDTTLARISNSIATELWQIAAYDSAESYAQRVLFICEKNASLIDTSHAMYAKGSFAFQLLLQKTYALRALGIIFAERSDYSRSIQHFNASLKIAEWLGDRKGAGNAIGNLGRLYCDLGKYPEALNYYLRSLQVNESNGDKAGMSIDYGNIGIVYRLEGNYSEALKYVNRALEIQQSLNDKQGMSNSYNSIGLIHRLKGEYPEAIMNYERALQIRRDAGYKKGVAFTLIGIGTTYDLQKDHELAKKYYEEALGIFEAIGDQHGVAGTYINLALLYYGIGKNNLAEKYYNDALPIALKTRSTDEVREIYNGLSGLDSAKGDFKNALVYYKLYIAYRDSIFNETNTKKLVQHQMQYDFDKKTAADSIRNAEQQKQENLKHDNEIKQQRLFTYGGIGGFLLMLVVAAISFRAFRNKRKANEIISHQKAMVEEKQKEILDSIHYAKRIQQSMLPTEKYIERILRNRHCK